MKKVIMLPTDFSVESLNTLKLALGRNEGKKVHVLLVYGEHASDSITELMFYKPVNTIRTLRNEDFDEALSVLKNRYESTIASLNIKVINHASVAVLHNFVEANGISEIFLPRHYQFELPKNGFDLTPLVKKSKLPYQELEWDTSFSLSDQIQLNALFNINW